MGERVQLTVVVKNPNFTGFSLFESVRPMVSERFPLLKRSLGNSLSLRNKYYTQTHQNLKELNVICGCINAAAESCHKDRR